MELKVDPRKDALIGPAMRRFSDAIQGHLQLFKDGKTKESDLYNSLYSTLYAALILSAVRGYDLAVKAANVPASDNTKSAVISAAKKRASLAARMITNTSDRVMDAASDHVAFHSIHASVSKKTVASKERADGIVNYEMPKIMFMGMRKGWSISGRRNPTKRWLTASGDPCEICLENEDAGPIGIDEVFPSGDFEPPGHPKNCECILGLYI